MTNKQPIDQDTWKGVLRSAFSIFRGFEIQGYGTPPFSLGGGTVLMFRWKHRLSKDVDFFGYDAQWITMLSPRLNDDTRAVAVDYLEQANGLKIILPHGDIDFIVSGDVLNSLERERGHFEGREFTMDPSAEILAKKMFYRAASFKARDVYDMSAALDLDGEAARAAIQAAKPKYEVLKRRLLTLAEVPEAELAAEIVPYAGPLAHARGMVRKVLSAIEPPLKAQAKDGPVPKRSPVSLSEGYER